MIHAFTRLIPVFAVLGLLSCEGHDLVESRSFAGPITELHLRLDAGDIALVASDEPGARVEVDLGYHGGTAPELQTFVDGSLLRVWLSCEDGCWDLVGRVTVYAPRGVCGKLDTGEGDIEIEGAAGDLVLECSTGAIRGLALTSARLAAVAERCPVSLAYATTPTLVDVDTERGGVAIDVPSGAYMIDAHSGSGSIEISGVDSDPGSRSELILTTHHGDIFVNGF